MTSDLFNARGGALYLRVPATSNGSSEPSGWYLGGVHNSCQEASDDPCDMCGVESGDEQFPDSEDSQEAVVYDFGDRGKYCHSCLVRAETYHA